MSANHPTVFCHDNNSNNKMEGLLYTGTSFASATDVSSCHSVPSALAGQGDNGNGSSRHWTSVPSSAPASSGQGGGENESGVNCTKSAQSAPAARLNQRRRWMTNSPPVLALLSHPRH
uniref:Uncharacterized protein n=1 Tax=Pseudictyota dubia TaxID=2749911 RepID=A0A7R9ZH82_9STRA